MARPVYLVLLLLMSGLMLASGINDNCPYQTCTCYDEVIDCRNIELKKLPPLNSVNITQPFELKLNDNSITQITAGVLPPRLSSIDFQGNPITSIDQDAFNGSVDTLTQLSFNGADFKQLPSAFLQLNNLSHLILIDMEFLSLDDNVMKHLGATLQTLLLSNVGITAWPTCIQYLPNLGTLELSSTTIQVPDNGFDKQINTLFSLNLENGILTEIPSAVTKLTNLKYLVLDNNNISRVTGIPNSSVLSVLSIHENRISEFSELSEALLSVSSSLTELRLSNNQLTHLPALSAMVKLQKLYLTDNAISYAGTSRLPWSLVNLELEHNNFKSIESFMQDATDLTDLNLIYNSITEIKGQDIPASVQTMDISSNQLTELSDDSFPLNSNMQTLNLDSNPIAKISAKAFVNLSKLTYLTMASTKITRLPVTLVHLTSVVNIELGGNDDMVCTCAEKDVRSWVQIGKVSISGSCGVSTIENFVNVMIAECP